MWCLLIIFAYVIIGKIIDQKLFNIITIILLTIIFIIYIYKEYKLINKKILYIVQMMIIFITSILLVIFCTLAKYNDEYKNVIIAIIYIIYLFLFHNKRRLLGKILRIDPFNTPSKLDH